MVKIKPEQMKHNYRGYSEHMNEDFVWRAPSLERRTIVCFCERSEHGSGEANWTRLLQNCKVHAVIPWEQLIGNRQAVFVGVDSNREKMSNVRKAVNRAHLALRKGVAFPSEALAAAVNQALQDAPTYSFYDVLIEAIPDQSLGVYIVYEDKNPIYVGLTVRPWAERMSEHRKSQREPDDKAGFMDYMRYHRACSCGWDTQFLPYEQCASLAILGQLTPDLVNDEKSEQLLTKRYSEDPLCGLRQAEAALIACLRPHFNQERNTYRRPLQETDYVSNIADSA